jgi:hypothetical protein
MQTLIYILAGISIVLSIGGLSAYSTTKHPGLLISSVVSIGLSVLAVVLVHWWPLVVGFGINWLLKLAGLDPSRSG